MDDEPSYDAPRSPSPAQMSKVPSWISVGLAIGVLIGLALRPTPKAPEVRVVEVTKMIPRPTALPTVDAIFEEWQAKFAVWRDDTAQIVVWNQDKQELSDSYEVRRVDGHFYYRPLNHLTRELMNYGDELPANAPIRFAGAKERTQKK
jgi:hypothetical protein